MIGLVALTALTNIDNRYGTPCGSWLLPNRSYSDLAPVVTDHLAACAEAHDEREPIVLSLGLLALGLAGFGVVRRYPPGYRPPAEPRVTPAWQQTAGPPPNGPAQDK